MANHTAVKVGGWVFRDPIEADEITGIQEQLLKCPNFDDGSTHTPTDAITLIGGSGGIMQMHLPGIIGLTGADNWTLRGNLAMVLGARLRLTVASRTLSGNLNLTVNDAVMNIIDSLGGDNRTVSCMNADAQNGDFKFIANMDASYYINCIAEGYAGVTVSYCQIAIAMFSGNRWFVFGGGT